MVLFVGFWFGVWIFCLLLCLRVDFLVGWFGCGWGAVGAVFECGLCWLGVLMRFGVSGL